MNAVAFDALIPPSAISIRQPWAWCILHAGKDVENRTESAIRLGRMKPGWIAIHASKGMTRDEYEHCRDTFVQARVEGVTFPRPDELVRGAIVGTVVVTEVVKESESPWWFGPRGLRLKQPGALFDPVPASGQLGYFAWKRGGEVASPLPWMRKYECTPQQTEGRVSDGPR